MANHSIGSLWSSPFVTLTGDAGETRHNTIIQLQWALAIACAYLVLFSQPMIVAAALVIVAFLVLNLVLGRLQPTVTNTTLFILGIALVDAILIAASLYVAGQLSPPLLMLCVGILVLAIGGLSIGAIAVATIVMTVAYLLLVWLAGSAPLWQSSVLLRVPLLFVAAISYAWLVEIGRRPPSAHEAFEAPTGLESTLNVQLEAIKRCQAAVASGEANGIETALNDIATQNQAMHAKLIPAHG